MTKTTRMTMMTKTLTTMMTTKTVIRESEGHDNGQSRQTLVQQYTPKYERRQGRQEEVIDEGWHPQHH